MSSVEKQNRLNVRRSVILSEDVQQGQKLGDVKVKFKRPGYGISPDLYETLLEREFNKPLSAGALVDLSDLR